MKKVNVKAMLLSVIGLFVLSSCVGYQSGSGQKLVSLGGSVQVFPDGAMQANHEKSFGDAASLAKHAVWAAGISNIASTAGSVLKQRSANGVTKSVTNSNNATSITNTANNNAKDIAINANNNATTLEALKSNNALEALKIENVAEVAE